MLLVPQFDLGNYVIVDCGRVANEEEGRSHVVAFSGGRVALEVVARVADGGCVAEDFEDEGDVLVFVVVLEVFEAHAGSAGDEHEDYVNHDGCFFWFDIGRVRDGRN